MLTDVTATNITFHQESGLFMHDVERPQSGSAGKVCFPFALWYNKIIKFY